MYSAWWSWDNKPDITIMAEDYHCDKGWMLLGLMSYSKMAFDWIMSLGEIRTWRAMVPLVCFHLVEFHDMDRVKRQLGGRGPVASSSHMVTIDGVLDLRPTQNYLTWWQGAYGVHFLSREDILANSRDAASPVDILPAALDQRDMLNLPWDASDLVDRRRGMSKMISENQLERSRISKKGVHRWMFSCPMKR
ncbi:hypothetical protein HN51_016535 [Arachis hypogaea]